MELAQRLRRANCRGAGRDDAGGALLLSPSQVRWLASLLAYDPATGACLDDHFRSLVATEWQRSLRANREFGLIVVALQDLPKIPGERDPRRRARRLRATVEAIRSVLRAWGDAVGRLDDTEFGILLPETDRKGVRDVVKRLLAVLGQTLETPAPGGGASVPAVQLCSVTLSRASAGERGWRGTLDAARRLLRDADSRGGKRVMHYSLEPSHRRTIC